MVADEDDVGCLMTPDDVWTDVVSAFAHYGKRITPRLRGDRRKLVEKLLAEGYEATDLIAAVNGYVRFHKGLDAEFSHGKTARDYFTPESVFRWEKIENRIEIGLDGPWEAPLSHEDQVKAKQRAARERVEAARAAQEGGHLKAV